MDEKELVRRIRNSFSAGKSEPDIVREMMGKGYKLEYISILVSKAKGKGIVLKAMAIMLFLGLAAFLYAGLSTGGNVKVPMDNPLVLGGGSGSSIPRVTGAVVGSGSGSLPSSGEIAPVITPEFISYILNELGAWQLHANPLTGSPAVLGFVIGDQAFYSEVDTGIESFEGSSNNVDVIFYSSSNVIIRALSSDDSRGVVLASFDSGESSLSVVAAEPELFTKGYLNLYEELGLS
ncbi:MAG: hypothetical protein ACI83O_000914 [Patescibacteria group bacterium]|jgi:hypothetical protein